MSIIERTTKLQLTQFEGSSINPAILDYYTADMAIIDSAFSDADTRLSALESTFQGHADRISALETWKTDTVDPTLSDYGTRIGALETWKDDVVTVALADHADRLTALETWKTDTVTVELASLDGRVDAIEQIIHDLSVEGYYDLVARLDALEAKVETNSNDITTLNANLTRLDNRLTEDETEIVSLGNGLVALANRVTLLEGCCEEVRGVLADHNTRINKNASDIAELDARLTRDEANISGNASDIVILANQNSTQSDQIQDLYDKYNSIDPDMPTNLYSRVGALETIVGDDALQTTAQTVTGAINELVAGVTDVDADEVDYNNSDSGLTATDVQGAIDEVNGKVGVDSARIGALETTVGGAGSGLVKAVDDLSSESTQIQLSVSQLSASVIGIGQRVDTLESTVGDASAGLVKDVADLQTTVGDANSGLVKDVSDMKGKVYMADYQRYSDIPGSGSMTSGTEKVVTYTPAKCCKLRGFFHGGNAGNVTGYFMIINDITDASNPRLISQQYWTAPASTAFCESQIIDGIKGHTYELKCRATFTGTASFTVADIPLVLTSLE